MVPEIWSVTDRIFVILDHFLNFSLHKNWKNQNFEKMIKMAQDITILHKSTKNHDHIICYTVAEMWQGFILA